jgi:hypothetical protein
LLSDIGRRFHFSGELVRADRPRFSGAGREVFSQRLFERPQQRFAQGVVVGKLDAIVTFATLAAIPEVAGALFYERLFAVNPPRSSKCRNARPLSLRIARSGVGVALVELATASCIDTFISFEARNKAYG